MKPRVNTCRETRVSVLQRSDRISTEANPASAFITNNMPSFSTVTRYFPFSVLKVATAILAASSLTRVYLEVLNTPIVTTTTTATATTFASVDCKMTIEILFTKGLCGL